MKETSRSQHTPVLGSITGTECLAVAATIAASTVAHADPIRYDNDTGFFWTFATLDLTLPAADQTYGSPSGTSVYLSYFSDYYFGQYYRFGYVHYYTSGNGAELWNSGFSNRYAAPHNQGDLIGPDLTGGAWNQSSTLDFTYYGAHVYYYNYQYYYDYFGGNRGILPNDGTPTYIGVRLTIDNALHYGWIGVTNNGGFFDVFAWGYETDPGVAIQAGAVPSPGPMGLLAIGAAGLLKRKKRVS